ncbi:Arabinanase/levansucrase/invertase [Tothia fuscella]|uniref:Arabinanase/levansucrase/invertase n=1 Tax=Tothia fuscella TaxID=1048955 RepID=A0A9P4NPJ5_9PEZI|nr:Arabinanase/levansucrase/invertase [Tothia fuscella]
MAKRCRALVLFLSLGTSISFRIPGNPILADGKYYSADPAPFVANDTLYICAGRDEAPNGVNDFRMNEWQILATPNPSTNEWTHFPSIAKPEALFSWAIRGKAYAAQVVPGLDGRFYLYAPVSQARSSSKDPFGIGVAVSNSPTGPFKDLHPQGPIISQSAPPPGNTIQNIDPTVLIDDDKRIYIYFGTFGQLKAYELKSDMITPISSTLTNIRNLPGFFEAPWLVKRDKTYYLIYAGNNAGPDSPCTPTSYHACQAYATASSPLGPWTYRGIVLDVVSSTTSHAGAIKFKNQWYLAYHTADADGGGHFRRSVAVDKLEFDDSANPPRIKKLQQTHRPKAHSASTRNIALKAKATSQNSTPIQYWIKAVNDGSIPTNPLPPEYWSSYAAERSPQKSTLTLTWNTAVTLSGAAMVFFADQKVGSNVGVAPPAEWHLEYQDTSSQWVKIPAAYTSKVSNTPEEIKFSTISTKVLRAVLTASGSGNKFAGVGVKEWLAYAPTAS